MRVLGFSKRWQKLSNPTFTTFRFPRKDRDWAMGEEVQIIVKPRRKGGGERLGIAKIIEKEQRWIVIWWSGEWGITADEAIKDGFNNRYDMLHWLEKAYNTRHCYNLMNKLTLSWIEWN